MHGNIFLEESFRVKPNFSFKDPSSKLIFGVTMIWGLGFEKDILEKEHKKLYNDYIKKIIKYLTKISLTLKGIPPEERKAKLLEYIKRVNGIIETHRKKYVNNETRKIDVFHYSNGILVPFSLIEKTTSCSNLVRNIRGKGLMFGADCQNRRERLYPIQHEEESSV